MGSGSLCLCVYIKAEEERLVVVRHVSIRMKTG